MTKKTYKALCLVKKAKRVSAKQFALLMWPDSKMHTKVSNQGNGSCRGKAAWLAGGAYLRKLEKKGLVKWSVIEEGFILTGNGLKEIVAYENKSDHGANAPY